MKRKRISFKCYLFYWDCIIKTKFMRFFGKYIVLKLFNNFICQKSWNAGHRLELMVGTEIKSNFFKRDPDEQKDDSPGIDC